MLRPHEPGKNVGDFSRTDESHLIRIAKIASVAMDNAWGYQPGREAERTAMPTPTPTPSVTELRREIARALGADLGARQSLQACAEAIVLNADVALARIWVLDGSVLELQASAGLLMHPDDARARVPVGQFSVGHIAQTRRPFLTNSILDHPHIHDKEWSRREGLTSFAGCPLLVDNELEGVIAMLDNKPISAEAFAALTAAAHEIAVSVRRQRVVSGRETICDDPVDASHRSEHAVILTSLDGVITDWNSGAEEYFGYRRHEALGQPLAILVPAGCDNDYREIMHQVARGTPVFRGETVRRHKGGRVVEVRLTVFPLRDPLGVPIGAITVAHDVADVKQLEKKYRLAQKMESFGQLAGGVAHDFNNLLTVILGYSEIVLSRLAGGDPASELVAEIHKAGLRAETLTRQLLSFSRKEVLESKVLDINAVVSDTEKMLRRLIGEDILMTTIFATTPGPARIDAGQLQQVILNLAINARDAMPRGGRLTIETNNVTFDEATTQLHPHVQAGDYVMLAVSDTGIGMSAATQARIFEPLFTTKGPGKGTGLGLTTVQNIVDQYGGHIEVHSELGHGSTFKVFVPRVHEPISLKISNTRLRIIPRGNETVLLVEDEDTVRALAKNVLEACGYNVLEAANGQDALALAERHEGPIQLLVSDVVMPHLGGRNLADRLLALRPKAKVLFLSGYTNDAVLRHGVVEPEFAFLQKPFSTGALAQKVREVLDQR